MQNTQPYFSQLDIKDAVTLLGDSKTLASPESNSEFCRIECHIGRQLLKNDRK